MGIFDKLFKKKAEEIYSHADYNIIFENKIVEEIEVEQKNIGLLNIPTGQIVVCDPLVVPDALPLIKTVPIGKYPVKIYVAKTKESGDRYAIAKLEISTKKADKWVLALREGEDISTLDGNGDFFGFAVDAGLGGFFDVKAGIEYNFFIDKFIEENPNGNIYDDFFAAEFKKNARDQNDPTDYGDWVNFTLPKSDLNITMFQSGYGDGIYPAYWGMTKDNEIVSLVIDFHVLLLPD
jgi:hypothetical protein